MLILDSQFILLKNTYTIIRVKDSTKITCNRIYFLSVKKNLDGIFSMDYDFAKVLYSCRSVDHLGSWILDLGSWILNIYLYRPGVYEQICTVDIIYTAGRFQFTDYLFSDMKQCRAPFTGVTNKLSECHGTITDEIKIHIIEWNLNLQPQVDDRRS